MTISTEKNRKLDELRDQYERGEIDRETISDLLEILIMAEISKPDEEIDGAWLDACSELMVEVDKEELFEQQKRAEETWQAIQERFHSRVRPHWSNQVKGIMRVVACLIVLLGVGTIGHIAWIQGKQLHDGQVYRVEGHVVEIGNLADADEIESESLQCQTENFTDVCKFFETTPLVPTWLPDGWTIHQYSATKSTAHQALSVVYEKEGEEKLLGFHMDRVHDISLFSADIPQDNPGSSIILDKGTTVYITKNNDIPTAVWVDGDATFVLSGPISEEDLVQMILSIQ